MEDMTKAKKLLAQYRSMLTTRRSRQIVVEVQKGADTTRYELSTSSELAGTPHAMPSLRITVNHHLARRSFRAAASVLEVIDELQSFSPGAHTLCVVPLLPMEMDSDVQAERATTETPAHASTDPLPAYESAASTVTQVYELGDEHVGDFDARRIMHNVDKSVASLATYIFGLVGDSTPVKTHLVDEADRYEQLDRRETRQYVEDQFALWRTGERLGRPYAPDPFAPTGTHHERVSALRHEADAMDRVQELVEGAFGMVRGMHLALCAMHNKLHDTPGMAQPVRVHVPPGPAGRAALLANDTWLADLKALAVHAGHPMAAPVSAVDRARMLAFGRSEAEADLAGAVRDKAIRAAMDTVTERAAKLPDRLGRYAAGRADTSQLVLCQTLHCVTCAQSASYQCGRLGLTRTHRARLGDEPHLVADLPATVAATLDAEGMARHVAAVQQAHTITTWGKRLFALGIAFGPRLAAFGTRLAHAAFEAIPDTPADAALREHLRALPRPMAPATVAALWHEILLLTDQVREAVLLTLCLAFDMDKQLRKAHSPGRRIPAATLVKLDTMLANARTEVRVLGAHLSLAFFQASKYGDVMRPARDAMPTCHVPQPHEIDMMDVVQAHDAAAEQQFDNAVPGSTYVPKTSTEILASLVHRRTVMAGAELPLYQEAVRG